MHVVAGECVNLVSAATSGKDRKQQAFGGGGERGHSFPHPSYP